MGEVLLSGTDDHLVLGEDRRLHYSAEPRESSYRPSVDVFFASLARNWPRPGVAVLLTGMGRDGAQGLLALRAPGLANHRPGRVIERRLGHAQGRRRDRRSRRGPATDRDRRGDREARAEISPQPSVNECSVNDSICDPDTLRLDLPGAFRMSTEPVLTEHKVTVLLVDDQPMIGEAVRRMLAGEPDIDFHYCRDAAKAIERRTGSSPR